MHRPARLPVTCVLIVALVGCATRGGVEAIVNPEPRGHSWWLRTTFVPHGTQVRGIPVKRIDPAWCKADELTEQALPEALRSSNSAPSAHFEPGISGFSAEGVFGGRPLQVVIGAYETCTGQASTFMLVLAADLPAWSPRKVVQVETLAQQPVMMYVSADPVRGVIYVPTCFQCDHIALWRWDAAHQRFVSEPDPEFGD